MLSHPPAFLRACATPSAILSALKIPGAVQLVQPVRHAQPVRCCTHNRSMATNAHQTFFLDEFAQKQFNDSNPDYSGTRIHVDPAAFVLRVEQYHHEGRELANGYAPFCKHVFVPNFTGAKLGSLAITPENRHLLQTAYSRRRPEELPVLSRWFRLQDVQPVPQAKFLDCILYSREQLMKEYQAMPEKGNSKDLPQAPWGIISVKAQDEDYETPMQPITIMRNSLGREKVAVVSLWTEMLMKNLWHSGIHMQQSWLVRSQVGSSIKLNIKVVHTSTRQVQAF